MRARRSVPDPQGEHSAVTRFLAALYIPEKLRHPLSLMPTLRTKAGNRANLTIGRALQLVVRNVGGGRPGEVDRATFGNPGKVGFCFPEDEEGSPWEPLSADYGFAAGTNTVTLFPGEGQA